MRRLTWTANLACAMLEEESRKQRGVLNCGRVESGEGILQIELLPLQ